MRVNARPEGTKQYFKKAQAGIEIRATKTFYCTGFAGASIRIKSRRNAICKYTPLDCLTSVETIRLSASLVRPTAAGKGLHGQRLPEFCLVAQNGGTMFLPPFLLVAGRLE